MTVGKRKTGEQWTIICLFLLCATRSCHSATHCDAEDSASLLEFKAAFIDDEGLFTSWSADADCCHWDGVKCSSTGRVQGLTVQGGDTGNSTGPALGLDGSQTTIRDPRYKGVVGETLGNLTGLENLTLESLYFDGNIPTTWGRLVNLKAVSLNCNFTGSIPREFGLLSELVSWEISTSSAVGSNLQPVALSDGSDLAPYSLGQLPEEICNLTNLEDVHLTFLSLTGELPACLDRWRRITTLEFQGNNITGPIPSFLGNLSLLANLDLSSNFFAGSIPASLEYLQLNVLDLSYNLLTGSIPPWITKLQKLNTLGLTGNELAGQIPPEIGDLQSLQSIALDNNNLTGEIPLSFGRLVNLKGLDLSFNNLWGRIPAELGNLTMCGYINLSDNYALSGSIPPELGQIAGLQLVIENLNLSGPIPDTLGKVFQLFAGRNSLTGGLPSSLASLDVISLPYNKLSSFGEIGSGQDTGNISQIELQSNLLGGSLPEWLSKSSQMYSIDLSDNLLEGEIPVSLLTLPNLMYLNLSYNQFTSELPSGPFVSNVLELDLHQTGLHGHISGSFAVSFPGVEILDLGSNNLSGIIPSSMGEIVGLDVLDLSRNNFSGGIPRSFSHMVVLDLSQNMLSGTIPPFVSLTASADTLALNGDFVPSLDLSSNYLTGNLPPSLISAAGLVRLRLGNNRLGGEIPDVFGSCQLFQSISLHNNKFHGNLPASLQNCSSLAVLDLGWNDLHGSLPPWLKNLAPTIRVLMIGSNKFHGALPAWLSNFTSLQVLDLSGNEFSGPIPSGLNRLRGLLRPGRSLGGGTLYEDDITITVKGQDLHFQYILSATTSVDLSGNKVYGDIPAQLGDLQGLLFLNLSQNNLSGVIPSSFANMTALESVDLSTNQLSGAIPSQMAVGLTALTYLNVSSNMLSGRIPYLNQFTTFSAASFAGNDGLCGPPLPVLCSFQQNEPPVPAPSSRHESIIQKWVSFPAFGVGLAISFTCLSIFLLPDAYVGGRREKAAAIRLARRREPYGLFEPQQ